MKSKSNKVTISISAPDGHGMMFVKWSIGPIAVMDEALVQQHLPLWARMGQEVIRA